MTLSRAPLVASLLVASLLAGCAQPDSDAPPGSEAPGEAQQQTETFDIPAGGSIEYKLRVAKDAKVDYTWSAPRPLGYDFHGDTGETGYASHKKGTAVADQGSWTAPFTGNHGWYWKNNHRDMVRVTLTVEGDYTVVGVV